MAKTQADLDALIAGLADVIVLAVVTATTTAVENALAPIVQALSDKVRGVTIDLTPEFDKLSGLGQAISDAVGPAVATAVAAHFAPAAPAAPADPAAPPADTGTNTGVAGGTAGASDVPATDTTAPPA